ncbi:MAG: exodeoxyribonuclease VII small subunit [Planctomycetota bacterium]
MAETQTPNAGETPPSFEEAVEELETIIERIESGEVGLEQAIGQYESGVVLVKRCRAILDRAERRIEELTADGPDGLKAVGGADGADDDG